MSQRRPIVRTAPVAPPATPAPVRPRWVLPLIGTLLTTLATAGAAFAYLEKLTSDCKAESSKMIDRQEKLRAEILGRRERFVDAIKAARSMAELREFLTHRDSLHGYIFGDFAERSLADLEDEEQRNGKHMDEPSTFALMLNVEFIHAHVQAAAADVDAGPEFVSEQVLDAAQFQDVSQLKDTDLPALQRVGSMERGWLWERRSREMRDGRLIEACSVGVALQDLIDDVRYLNRPAVHVIYQPLFPQMRGTRNDP